jgi:hypothetical protein
MTMLPTIGPDSSINVAASIRVSTSRCAVFSSAVRSHTTIEVFDDGVEHHQPLYPWFSVTVFAVGYPPRQSPRTVRAD